MKMQCCVILKREPWHILCLGEMDAITIIEREKDNVALVLFSESGIFRKFYETEAKLIEIPQKQLQTRELNEINAIPNDVVADAIADIDKAIDAEFK